MEEGQPALPVQQEAQEETEITLQIIMLEEMAAVGELVALLQRVPVETEDTPEVVEAAGEQDRALIPVLEATAVMAMFE